MRQVMIILGAGFGPFWVLILEFTVYGWAMFFFCTYVAILGALGPDSRETIIREHRRQKLMDALTSVNLESDDDVTLISSIKDNNGWV